MGRVPDALACTEAEKSKQKNTHNVLKNTFLINQTLKRN